MDVLLVQRILPHYRVEFFKRLDASLSGDGGSLTVAYGPEMAEERPRSESVAADWARPSRILYGPHPRLPYLQPDVVRGGRYDAVVLEHSGRAVANHLLWAIRAAHRPRAIVYWGHAVDRSAGREGRRQRYKLRMANRADWWFAYSSEVAQVLEHANFPVERVTVVENAIDDPALLSALASAQAVPIEKGRGALGLGAGPIGLYCGRLTDDKRLDFLVDAADALRLRYQAFELVVIGDGPAGVKLRAASLTRPWLHLPGAVFGAPTR